MIVLLFADEKYAGYGEFFIDIYERIRGRTKSATGVAHAILAVDGRFEARYAVTAGGRDGNIKISAINSPMHSLRKKGLISRSISRSFWPYHFLGCHKFKDINDA